MPFKNVGGKGLGVDMAAVSMLTRVDELTDLCYVDSDVSKHVVRLVVLSDVDGCHIINVQWRRQLRFDIHLEEDELGGLDLSRAEAAAAALISASVEECDTVRWRMACE